MWLGRVFGCDRKSLAEVKGKRLPARLQIEGATKYLIRGTTFLTKNAPMFSRNV